MLSLNNQLLKMHLTVFRAMKSELAEKSTLTKLTILQIHTLLFLKEKKNPQGSELARYLRITAPTTTVLVNKLSTMKLIKREVEKKDRRIIRICLTRRGEQTLEAAMKERKKIVKKFLSRLTIQDKLDLLRIMKHITRN